MAAFLFGAAGALAKMKFTADISPLDLTAIRAIVACALVAVFLIINIASDIAPDQRCPTISAGVRYCLYHSK